MSDTVIRVENLSKRYFITHQTRGRRSQGGQLSEKLHQMITHPVRRLLGRREDALDSGKMEREEFWALKDVSFEVKRGDVLGIIGRNGAGKSTLLKILSRITEPTKGEIKIKGRIASLLEVGTGFHPELTGRENIFLNGSILGMSRVEIQSKFDEIVAFAEVEKFLDTQVKHYSSGMYVRLAFAVAAHLEPEILIVDEVLAVGDAQFQRKCLGKLRSSSEQGTTSIIVSHQLATLASLTSRSIMLAAGNLAYFGSTNEVINRYLAHGGFDLNGTFTNRTRAQSASILSAQLCSSSDKPSSEYQTCEEIHLYIQWENHDGAPVIVGFQINNDKGTCVMVAYDTPSDWDGSAKAKTGNYETRATIPKLLLPAGQYSIHLALDRASPRLCLHCCLDAIRFRIEDPMNELCFNRGALRNALDYMAMLPVLDWRTQSKHR